MKRARILLQVLCATWLILATLPVSLACSVANCQSACPMHQKPAAQRECCHSEKKKADTGCKCIKKVVHTADDAVVLVSGLALEIPVALPPEPVRLAEVPLPGRSAPIFADPRAPPPLRIADSVQARAPPHA